MTSESRRLIRRRTSIIHFDETDSGAVIRAADDRRVEAGIESRLQRQFRRLIGREAFSLNGRRVWAGRPIVIRQKQVSRRIAKLLVPDI